MSSPKLLAAADLEVGLDYGQFSLHTAANDPDLAVELIEVALESGIAQQEGLVTVISPHQNNFTMPLRIEVWSGEPASDIDSWEEAFEVHLDVADAGVYYESPTLGFEELPVPTGAYHALITGRGFVGHGWPGTTTPGDVWRIRLWPSAGPAAPARLRAFVDPRAADVAGRETEAPRYLDQARAAARRINADIQRGPAARPLTPQTGAVHVERRFPVKRAKLFSSMADISGWSSAMFANGDVAVGSRYWLSHGDVDDDVFDGLPTGTAHSDPRPPDTAWFGYDLEGTYVEVTRPTSAVTELQWIHMTGMGPVRRHDSVLPEPTVLCVTLVDDSDDDGPATVVAFEHRSVPIAWLDDLTYIWNRKLEVADLVYRLGR